MLVEVLEQIKQEVLSNTPDVSGERQRKQAAVSATSEPSFQKKASPEKVSELVDKLTRLGLAKYAAYVEELHDPDVAAELAIILAEELEKRASVAGNAFRPSDTLPSKSSVDPITAFALGLG